jgi:hypothetical protein
MAGGWTDIANDLNAVFANKNLRAQMGAAFRGKHGDAGHGGPGKVRYSFGRFIEDFNRPGTANPMLTDRQKGQFLIDAGSRHWDQTSLMNIETAIRNNLTRRGGPAGFDEKKIVFVISENATARQATATVKEVPATPTEEAHTKIEVICPPRATTDP